jgi:hypothetical protein
MRSVSVPIEPAGDIGVNLASFTRSLRATNLSPRTIQSYTESTQLLAKFLTEQALPTSVVTIQREHLEAFISSLLKRWKPATAHNGGAGGTSAPRHRRQLLERRPGRPNIEPIGCPGTL